MKTFMKNAVFMFLAFLPTTACIKDFPNNNWIYLFILDSLLNPPSPTVPGTVFINNSLFQFSAYSVVTKEDQTAPSASFTLALGSAPAAGTSVSIPVSSSNTAEGRVGQADGTWVPGFNLVFNDICPGANCWSSPQTVFVKGTDDALLDASIFAQYSIVLGNATSTDPAYSNKNPADVVAYNLDDEATLAPVSVIVSASNIITQEDQSAASSSFTVVLDTAPAPGTTVSIPVSSSNTAEGRVGQVDGTWVAGFNLIFDSTCPGANCWNIPKTVFVKGADDTAVDGPFMQYSIILGAVVSGDSRYSGYNPSDIPAFNLDNDSAGTESVIVVPVSGHFTTESGRADQFGVVLGKSPVSGKNAVIGFTSSNTGEGTVSPASLTFDSVCPGTNCWYTPKIITVSGVDDTGSPVVDVNTPYTVNLTSSTSTDTVYAALIPGSAALPAVNFYNVDNDSSGLLVTPASLGTSELGAPQIFNVTLQTKPGAGQIVVVNLSSGDTTEGTVSPASLTFDSTNWNNAAVHAVTVTPVDDFVVDGTVNYNVILSIDAGLTTDTNYTSLPNTAYAVSNSDNEAAAGFTISPVSGLTVTESGSTGSFTVALNTQPASPVTLSLSSSDTTEAVISPSVLTFNSADWNNAAAHTVIVTGVDDSVMDGNVSWTVTTSAAVSGDASYNGINPSDVTGSTTDNDAVGITWTGIAGKTVSEAGQIDSFSLVLNTAPNGTVIINFTVPPAHQRLYTSSSGWATSVSVTFTQTDWYIPQQVIIGSVQDTTMDRTGPAASDPVFNITVSAPSGTDTSGYKALPGSTLPVTNVEDEKFIFVTKESLAGTGTHYGLFDADPALSGGYWGAVNGDTNGIPEADNYCMMNAPAGTVGVYKALIDGGPRRKASVTANKGDGQVDWVFHPVSNYYRASDKAFIMTTNSNSLFIFGSLSAAFSAAGLKYTWSGLFGNWTSSGSTCNIWTSGASPQGNTSAVSSFSINDGTGAYTCGAGSVNPSPGELICVEQ